MHKTKYEIAQLLQLHKLQQYETILLTITAEIKTHMIR